jgi:hypothetical protein
MKNEKIDRILADEEALLPSSGFVGAVMERIREEAAAPQPIPFPWKRALLGAVAACVGLGWGVVELIRLAIAAAHDHQPVALQIPSTLLQPMESLGWAALALVVSLASWKLSRRMGGESQLL